VDAKRRLVIWIFRRRVLPVFYLIKARSPYTS